MCDDISVCRGECVCVMIFQCVGGVVCVCADFQCVGGECICVIDDISVFVGFEEFSMCDDILSV